MIKIPGLLAIKTIHGRNGDFNVGRLSTAIGEFVTKNAELDQYREGKYEGDFDVVEIRPSMYTTGGRMVIELRAVLGGMTLSNIDALSTDEAHRLSPQEVDPVDEDAQKSPPQLAPVPAVIASTAITAESLAESTVAAASDPLHSTVDAGAEQTADAALFGTLWPIGPKVRLDPTVDRRVFRQQRDRLTALGYEFLARAQEWHREAA